MQVFKSLIALIAAGLSLNAFSANPSAIPNVRLVTNVGEIEIELYPDKAPVTVKNFLAYVDAGFYNGTIFHRVIPNFMIQGGGLDQTMNEKAVRSPIKNEADNGRKNLTGTIAMARTGEPHSATAQFFINVKDNEFLDHRAKSKQEWGYAVFGKVVNGMDVVRRIESIPTHTVHFYENVPVKEIVIQRAERINKKVKK
jgi:cyclophilin family peptidyl-prolyl cis-trans isomerase